MQTAASIAVDANTIETTLHPSVLIIKELIGYFSMIIIEV